MDNWKELFPMRILQRGKKYYQEGRVFLNSYKLQGKFTGLVNGHHQYHVEGVYDQGTATSLFCDCPYAAEGNLCKHMVAVLFAVDQQCQSNPDTGHQQRLRQYLGPKFDLPFLSINPARLIGNYRFPRSIIYQALDSLELLTVEKEIIDERIANNPAQSPSWTYTLAASFDNCNFLVEVYFDHEKIQDISIKSFSSNCEENKVLVRAISLLKLASYIVDYNFGEGTNLAAQAFLEKFNPASTSDHLPIIKAYITASECLGNDYFLYFRVGTDTHMYKIKNLVAFSEQVSSGEKIKLGKFFNQPIVVTALDPSSRLWLNFINNIVSVMKLTRQNYSYNANLPNWLPLSDAIADKFDKTIQAGGQFAIDQVDGKAERVIRHLRPTINIHSIGATSSPNRAIKVHIDLPDDLIRGQQKYYQVDSNQWYAYTGVSPSQLGGEQDLTFGTSTMAEFYYQVLPQIEEQFAIKVPRPKLSRGFMAPLPRTVFFLDYHEGIVECRLAFAIGDKALALQDCTSEEFVNERQIDEAIRHVKEYFDQYNPTSQVFELHIEDAGSFLEQGIDSYREYGIIKATAAFKKLYHRSETKVSVGMNLQTGLLNLTVKLGQLSPTEISQLLTEYNPQRKYYRLTKDDVIKVDQPGIEELLAMMKKFNLTPQDFTKSQLKLPAYRALYLDDALSKQQAIDYRSSADLRQLVKNIKQPAIDNITLSPELHADLRPYQVVGVKWLATLSKYGFGGLLADEMGLGKTLQIIALILQQAGMQQCLIVAPAAVIYNWQAEFKHFAPAAKIFVLDGSKKGRANQLLTAPQDGVIITSYDALKRDIDLYENRHFAIEVLDEAQQIKNHTTMSAKAVKAVNADQRVALTGTPIENRLSELWSIFDYLNPGLLGTYRDFKKQYEKPIIEDQDQQALKKLKQLVQPFVLRRLKKNVLQDLPPKIERIILTPLAGKQKKLYQVRAARLVGQLKNEDDSTFKQYRFAILAEITRLRELCCSPQLLNKDSREKPGKMVQTLDIIQNEISNGHKILLFSQFTSMLAILKRELRALNVKCFILEGETKKADRLKLVKEFNEYDGPAVFLISLLAGGTGLNLTGADVVIHYDPWWNVAMENQATDRAHRIGQQNTVKIYKMVTKDTIEQRIIEMQKKKASLANSILSGKMAADTKLDRETLLKVLG